MHPYIQALQSALKEKQYDAYLMESSDDHSSEYVGDYYKTREAFSGFTGSAGTLLVTPTEAFLWTDGRYFIQAERQLENSGITLMKMAQKGVPTLEEKIGALKLQTIACDLSTIASDFTRRVKCNYIHDEAIINDIWLDRPRRACHLAFDYDVTYQGASREQKLYRVRWMMNVQKAKGLLLCALDDIAWLLNIRGNDVACNPVVLSFALIEHEQASFYVQDGALDDELKAKIEEAGYMIRPYEAIYQDLELYDAGNLWLDLKKTNARLVQSLPKPYPVINSPSPIGLMKAIKNEAEIENTKKAHIMDGVAITKWMYWLKNEILRRDLTELEIQDYLYELRKTNPSFIEPSFDTICAYNSNAAMMHYEATKENYGIAKKGGLILCDSGGQYLEGTTDITRTVVLEDMPEAWKVHYTTALRSFLRLQSATFLEGCTGLTLDILARGPIWDMHLDYQCGTGHGVGHLLNVHEGPQGFRWRTLPNRNEGAVLMPGMITTDEPGIYINDSHGIRHENELLCVFKEENEYGRFLAFEPITYAPIDLDGVLIDQMEKSEIKALNDYHAMVYATLKDYLTKEEADWLKKATRKVG